MVTLDSIKDIFENIRKDNAFDLKSDLLWSFFFCSKDLKDMVLLVEEIESLGEYEFDKIYKNEDLFWLQILQPGVNTENSLFKKCEHFYQIVDKLNNGNSLELVFDGWDVGRSA